VQVEVFPGKKLRIRRTQSPKERIPFDERE
jgi:hypothetical protein